MLETKGAGEVKGDVRGWGYRKKGNVRGLV